MRAAQHFAIQQTLWLYIRCIQRTSSDFIHPIRPQHALADHIEVAVDAVCLFFFINYRSCHFITSESLYVQVYIFKQQYRSLPKGLPERRAHYESRYTVRLRNILAQKTFVAARTS